MKHVDERRMRLAYFAIFLLAALVMVTAIWDVSYNQERMIHVLISALGGLLVVAIAFFVITELILRDSLDLRPKPLAAVMDQDIHAKPSDNKVNERVAHKATAHADGAAPMMSPALKPHESLGARVSIERDSARNDRWHPHMQPAAAKPMRTADASIVKVDVPALGSAPLHTPRDTQDPLPMKKAELVKQVPRMPPAPPKPHGAPVTIDMPTQQTLEPRRESLQPGQLSVTSPAAIPKPHPVPGPAANLTLEKMSFETGNPQFRVPRGAPGQNPHAILESARVLCGACGLYFRVDIERARPLSVPCPKCTSDLGLSGAKQEAEHVKLRCRHCGDFLKVPRLAVAKATQCSTCGQASS